MIRITGGEAKGRSLKVYRGGQVRPTSDKVRQAIYNILEHRFDLNFEGLRCLDLFAGSGSLGAEFISRGGAALTAVESDSKTISVLRDNLKMLQKSISSRTIEVSINSQRVERFLKHKPQHTFDLVIADPPYKDHLGPKLLEYLAAEWMSTEGLVIIEHEKRDIFTPPYGWSLDDRRLYGDTLVSFCSLNQKPSSTT